VRKTEHLGAEASEKRRSDGTPPLGPRPQGLRGACVPRRTRGSFGFFLTFCLASFSLLFFFFWERGGGGPFSLRDGKDSRLVIQFAFAGVFSHLFLLFFFPSCLFFFPFLFSSPQAVVVGGVSFGLQPSKDHPKWNWYFWASEASDLLSGGVYLGTQEGLVCATVLSVKKCESFSLEKVKANSFGNDDADKLQKAGEAAYIAGIIGCVCGGIFACWMLM
jgi:hypothetical protein